MKNVEVTTKISWDTFISLASRFIEVIDETKSGEVSLNQAEILEQLASLVRNKAENISSGSYIRNKY